MQTVVDTGPLVALIDPNDQFHVWAVESVQMLDGPLRTCEAVITEAHFLLRRTFQGQPKLNALLGTGKLELAFRAADHLEEIANLMERYTNVPMSYADACIVRLAEYPASRILTTDAGFDIYRTTTGRRLAVTRP